MSLEEDVQRLVWRAVAGDPKMLEALVSGESVEADALEIAALLSRKLNAVEEAVVLLARELDKRG